MAGHKLRTLRATLLLVSLLVSTASAFAQGKSVLTLPGANVGVSVPKVGDVTVGLPRIEAPRTVSAIPAVPLPKADVKIGPAVLPGTGLSAGVGGSVGRPDVGVSATVPAVGGLTPQVDATVRVNTTAPDGLLEAGANVGPRPDAPNFAATDPAAAQEQLLQQRLALLPTCR